MIEPYLMCTVHEVSNMYKLLSRYSTFFWRIKRREQIYGVGSGRKERVRCMKRVTWELTSPYVNFIANESLLCDSGNSNRGSVST